jgi:hypothetical protein
MSQQYEEDTEAVVDRWSRASTPAQQAAPSSARQAPSSARSVPRTPSRQEPREAPISARQAPQSAKSQQAADLPNLEDVNPDGNDAQVTGQDVQEVAMQDVASGDDGQKKRKKKKHKEHKEKKRTLKTPIDSWRQLLEHYRSTYRRAHLDTALVAYIVSHPNIDPIKNIKHIADMTIEELACTRRTSEIQEYLKQLFQSQELDSASLSEVMSTIQKATRLECFFMLADVRERLSF